MRDVGNGERTLALFIHSRPSLTVLLVTSFTPFSLLLGRSRSPSAHCPFRSSQPGLVYSSLPLRVGDGSEERNVMRRQAAVERNEERQRSTMETEMMLRLSSCLSPLPFVYSVPLLVPPFVRMSVVYVSLHPSPPEERGNRGE